MWVEVSILCFLIVVSSASRPEAKTENGRLKGVLLESFHGRTIYAFYNIPYSQRITPKRRFEELRDADPWYDVLDAGGPPVSCPQISLSNELKGVENCLIINIFSPVAPNTSYSAQLYPVIVYIHGGAYYFLSSGEYGPRYLLDNDVVLVSMNFRIGIPGFGSTRDHIMPGNLGLKDQLKALNWIQRNIRNFNGDKKSVTLVGMSSGAACVHFHYFSKKSKGLFHRVFMIGGTGTQPWSVHNNPRFTLRKISKNMGCPTNSSFDMVMCLEKLSPKELAFSVRTIQKYITRLLIIRTYSKDPDFRGYNARSYEQLYGVRGHTSPSQLNGIIPLAPVGPIVDDFSFNPFLVEYPYESLRAGRGQNVPLLMSNVMLEGIFPGAIITEDKDVLRELNDFWLSQGQWLLELKNSVPDELMNYTLHKIRKYYFGDDPIDEDSRIAFLKMISDRYFLTQSMKSVALHARYNSKIYYYIFDYRGGQSSSQRFVANAHKYGASHIDDLFYMFNITNRRDLETNSTDLLMIERMTSMLFSFAKTGIPSFGSTNVAFLPVKRSTSIYGPVRVLKIKSPNQMEMTDLENLGNVRFWESLPILSPRTQL